MLAYYIHHLSPFLLPFGNGWGVRYYGLAYVLAFLLGYGLYQQLVRRGYSDIPTEKVGDFILWWVVLGTLVGGRLGYLLFYDWEDFLHQPWIFFQIWKGGMASHGAMVGLFIATFLFARVHRVSWFNATDNLAVVAPPGVFLGRCANFINGELFGRASDVPWAVQFPKEILFWDPARIQALLWKASQIRPEYASLDAVIENHPPTAELDHLLSQVLVPRHPSQLYEAFLEGLLLCGILFFLRTRFRLPNGFLTGVFFLLYGIFRFVVEFFRQPDAPLVGWMSRGQFFSLFLLPLGLGFFLWALFHPTYAPRFQKK